ncbi:threonine synthase [Candidatus Micrarchaeota archaeon]|nr:threonine synthase [Candidatus Micrarchaeota archaeon]
MNVELKCCKCGKTYPAAATEFTCACGHLLEVQLDLSAIGVSKADFEKRPADLGVWRFREMVHPLVEPSNIVTRGEGNTFLYPSERVSAFVGTRTWLKHEGENPTGSFKDRGMTAGITEAVRRGAKTVICASTGNTSASLASYAAIAGLRCVVLMPDGKIAFGKLSQALAYGAKAIQVKGNFDQALALVRQLAEAKNYYVLNSVNPWRLEGQKTIVWEILFQMGLAGQDGPDWIVVPAGNVGNVSAFGKALKEWYELGWIEKLPRLAAVQAEGANPLYRTWKASAGGIPDALEAVENPDTIGSAIRIGKPVNWVKCLQYLKLTNGVAEQVSDQQMMDAKAVVDAAGIGCEPASAASVAGARKLLESGVISRGEKVACVLTGHVLKDADNTVNYHLGKLPYPPAFANAPIQAEASLDALEAALK